MRGQCRRTYSASLRTEQKLCTIEVMVSATKPAATSVLPSLCKAGSAAQPAFRGELWASRTACLDLLLCRQY